jgi:hypothetical protein
MGNLFEVLYDVLFQPQIAMRIIADQKNIRQALVVFFLSIIIPIWAMYFGLQAAGMSTMIHLFIGIKIFGSMVMWFMGTAVWHLLAEFYGGKGTAIGLFSTLGFAYFPQILIVPLWVFAALLPVSLKTIVMTAAALIILCWSLFLSITAMQEVYQFSAAKAVLVMFTPLLVMVLICGIAFTFLGSAIAQMPMWL